MVEHEQKDQPSKSTIAGIRVAEPLRVTPCSGQANLSRLASDSLFLRKRLMPSYHSYKSTYVTLLSEHRHAKQPKL